MVYGMDSFRGPGYLDYCYLDIQVFNLSLKVLDYTLEGNILRFLGKRRLEYSAT